MTKAVWPLAASLLLVLPACSGTGGAYPSLAVRPAEAKGFAEPEAPTPAPVKADPVLDAQVNGARQSLATITKGFDADAAAARAAQARAGARTVGNDAWLDAQTALAKLDDWRAQASSLSTDVDGWASARAAALQPPYAAVETLRTAVAAEVAREDADIRRLAASLPAA